MLVRTLALLATAGFTVAHQAMATPGLSSGASATLTIVVSNITTPGGTLSAALFSPQDDFPDGQTPTAFISRTHGSAVVDTFVFTNVAPGSYAVAVQHDLNNNGKLDRNMVGMPKEPWGISRDVRHSFRPPRFDEAAIDVSADTRIDIRIAQ